MEPNSPPLERELDLRYQDASARCAHSCWGITARKCENRHTCVLYSYLCPSVHTDTCLTFVRKPCVHMDTGSHHSVPFPLPPFPYLEPSPPAVRRLLSASRGGVSAVRGGRVSCVTTRPGLCENRAADWGPVSAQRCRVRLRGPRARALFGSWGSVPPLPVFGLKSGIQFDLLVSVHVPSTGSFSASLSSLFPIFELTNSQNGCRLLESKP